MENQCVDVSLAYIKKGHTPVYVFPVYNVYTSPIFPPHAYTVKHEICAT